MKTVKERDLKDLFVLAFELCARSSTQIDNKKMHDYYVEARTELESRVFHQPIQESSSLPSEGKQKVEKPVKDISDWNDVFSDFSKTPEFNLCHSVDGTLIKFRSFLGDNYSVPVKDGFETWLEDRIKKSMQNFGENVAPKTASESMMIQQRNTLKFVLENYLAFNPDAKTRELGKSVEISDDKINELYCVINGGINGKWHSEYLSKIKLWLTSLSHKKEEETWDEVVVKYLEEHGLRFDASTNSEFFRWIEKNYRPFISIKESDVVAFSEWIYDNDWFRVSKSSNEWEKRAGGLIHGLVIDKKTTKQLYQLFLTSKR